MTGQRYQIAVGSLLHYAPIGHNDYSISALDG
jgi:hypothetical protein